MKKSFIVFVILGIIAAVLYQQLTGVEGRDASPNIILIMTDDQGWGDVGYNGHPYLKTPHLNAMADNGVVFSRFYSASAVCSPTRGSVMTGRHPMRYGICHANCGHLPPAEISLAELVKMRGYRAGHFGKWHLGTMTQSEKDANRGGRSQHDQHYSPPWDNGYDVCFATESKVPTWDPMKTPSRSAEDVNASLVEGEYFGTAYWTGPGQKVFDNLLGDDSRIIMDRVLPFIDEAVHQEKPFLSVIWFHTPHLPVLTGEKYKNQYSALSEDEQHYYGCLTAMDDQIGRLRSHLRSLGIEKNTVLFFTSDNGPEGVSQDEGRTRGRTNGLRGRKRSLYEGGIRVPGIVEWPGEILGGQSVDLPAYTSDYFPTIAALLNIDLATFSRPYDGVDLLNILSGNKDDRALPFLLGNQAALIGSRYKIYSKDGGDQFQMYDLLEDISEIKDISQLKPQLFASMVDEWKQWKKSQEGSAAGFDYLD